MKTPPRHPLNAAQREALEARFALRVSARLEAGAQDLPHDITERLRVARQRSLAQMQTRVQAVPAKVATPLGAAQIAQQLAGVVASGTGALTGWTGRALARAAGHGRQLDDAPLGWGWRLASFMPLVALVAGLWGVHDWYQNEKIFAAADVDMALLTDDLPPSAYSDPGFEEYLHSGTENDHAASPLDAPEEEELLNTDEAETT